LYDGNSQSIESIDSSVKIVTGTKLKKKRQG